MADDANGLAESLNQHCRCISVDAGRLRGALETHPATAGLYDSILARQPHLFSASAVFVSGDQIASMRSVIGAVEQVVALDSYRARVLAAAPAAARIDHGPRGVFLGYDFHVGPDGPRLIEINTNAGGALLNAALAAAELACCPEVRGLFAGAVDDGAGLVDGGATGAAFVATFREEWRRQRGDAPLRRIAIVDDDPEAQYLYPEFLLFRELFESHGIPAVIADPRALEWRDGVLRHDGEAIDLVYNRLTDFALAESANAALLEAWAAGAIALTPHPRAHALYADKRNLALLSSPDELRGLGAPPEAIEILAAGIPPTRVLDPTRAEEWWRDRKRWFFKPVDGFGGRAAYRGDKLTRGAFASILGRPYVAQEVVPPSERTIEIDGALVPLKLDLRNYVYAGAVQLVAARLYRGQTTNFRTPGGGFAPVFTERPGVVSGAGCPAV